MQLERSPVSCSHVAVDLKMEVLAACHSLPSVNRSSTSPQSAKTGINVMLLTALHAHCICSSICQPFFRWMKTLSLEHI